MCAASLSELAQVKAALTSEQVVRATLETEKAALVKDRDGVISDVDRLVLRVKDMDRCVRSACAERVAHAPAGRLHTFALIFFALLCVAACGELTDGCVCGWLVCVALRVWLVCVALRVLHCRAHKKQEVDSKAAVEGVTSEWEARLAAATKALVDLRADLGAATKQRDEAIAEKLRLSEALDRFVAARV